MKGWDGTGRDGSRISTMKDRGAGSRNLASDGIEVQQAGRQTATRRLRASVVGDGNVKRGGQKEKFMF